MYSFYFLSWLLIGLGNRLFLKIATVIRQLIQSSDGLTRLGNYRCCISVRLLADAGYQRVKNLIANGQTSEKALCLSKRI